MYRAVETKMWSDPKFKNLSPNDKLLFIYFFTNQHAHLSGIYYLPPPVIQYETGLSESEIKKGIDTLSIPYLIHIDTPSDVIWVVNMLRYQSTSEKIMKHVATQLESLHKCPLIKHFLKYYEDLSIPYRYPIDTLSLQEQEQEQKQKQKQNRQIAKKSPRRPPPEFLKLSEEFHNHQKAVFPNLVKNDEKTILAGADIIEQLVRIDGHTLSLISDVLSWGVADSFWSPQLRSLGGMRKKKENGSTKFENLVAGYYRSRQVIVQPDKRTIQNAMACKEFLDEQ